MNRYDFLPAIILEEGRMHSFAIVRVDKKALEPLERISPIVPIERVGKLSRALAHYKAGDTAAGQAALDRGHTGPRPNINPGIVAFSHRLQSQGLTPEDAAAQTGEQFLIRPSDSRYEALLTPPVLKCPCDHCQRNPAFLAFRPEVAPHDPRPSVELPERIDKWFTVQPHLLAVAVEHLRESVAQLEEAKAAKAPALTIQAIQSRVDYARDTLRACGAKITDSAPPMAPSYFDRTTK